MPKKNPTHPHQHALSDAGLKPGELWVILKKMWSSTTVNDVELTSDEMLSNDNHIVLFPQSDQLTLDQTLKQNVLAKASSTASFKYISNYITSGLPL